MSIKQPYFDAHIKLAASTGSPSVVLTSTN